MTIALDWERYKQICDTPDVFSRWMLAQTKELTSADLALQIDCALAMTPIEKPIDHSGNTATDMFELSLTRESVKRIREEVALASSQDRTTSATSNRGLGGFVEAWTDYVEHLSKAGRDV